MIHGMPIVAHVLFPFNFKMYAVLCARAKCALHRQKLHDVAYSGLVTNSNARFACGSMVHFYLVQEMWLCEPHFLNKNVSFNPVGGTSSRLSRQTPGLKPTA